MTNNMTKICKKIRKMKENIERKELSRSKKKSETNRERAKVRLGMTAMLKFAENRFCKPKKIFQQELIRIFATRVFLETTNTRKKPLACLWKKFKAAKLESRLLLRRFREILYLIEYGFRVSKRVFHKKLLHPQISFQAFSVIIRTLAEIPTVFFFFDF